MAMQGEVLNLKTYPVKGLSAVSHDSVSVQPGDGFPGDRMFGFAKGNSGFNAADPKPLPKDRFLVLLEHEALAGLDTSIDADTQVFTVQDRDGEAQSFDLTTRKGQASASAFFADLLDLDDPERPVFAQAHPHRFTDVSVSSPQMMNAVSLINLASVNDLAAKAGVSIDPARFRGNILIDGWPALSELDLVGRTVTIGDVAFKVLKRTRRCPATRVNPTTAERDLDVPGLIRQHYGHLDMGVYMETLGRGELCVGDVVRLD